MSGIQMMQVVMLLLSVPAAQANWGDPYVNEAPLGPGTYGSSLSSVVSLCARARACVRCQPH